MPRKKKSVEPEEEVPSLKERAEQHIFEVLLQFEEITGIQISGVKVSRYRPAGFEAKETMRVEITT